MDVRLMLIAASALGFATIAAAEPANGPANSPAPAASSGAKERPVVLAAADIPAQPAAADADTAAPVVPARKPRAARVTTCRCADTPNQ